MQVLRVKATRVVRAFAEAVAEHEVALRRCCNLLAEASPDIQASDAAEAYDICREIRQMTGGLGAAEDNTNYSDAMK